MKRGSCPPPWTSEFVLGARTPILSNILGSYGYFRWGGGRGDVPGGKKHCDHQGHRARVPGSSRAGLCTRDKVTVTQKYVLARIHYTHSGKIRYLLITCPALANVQRAAGDEPKPFPLSYRDLRLVHCVGAAVPLSLPEPRPQLHRDRRL